PLDALLVVGGVGRILRGIGGQLLGGGGAQLGELRSLLLPVLSVTVVLSRGIVPRGRLVLAERQAAGGQQGQSGGCGRQPRQRAAGQGCQTHQVSFGAVARAVRDRDGPAGRRGTDGHRARPSEFPTG